MIEQIHICFRRKRKADFAFFTKQFFDLAVLATEALLKLEFNNIQSRKFPTDQAVLADDTTLQKLFSKLKSGSSHEKFCAAAVAIYVACNNDENKHSLFNHGFPEPALDLLSSSTSFDELIFTGLCDLFVFWGSVSCRSCVQGFSGDNIQDLVEKKVEIFTTIAKRQNDDRTFAIRKILQHYADLGNSCVQKAMRLNGLDIDAAAFFRNAAALQNHLESDFLKCLESFTSLGLHAGSQKNWRDIKTQISDLEIADTIRCMLNLYYMKTSSIAISTGWESGPFSLERRLSRNKEIYNGYVSALGGFDIRLLQMVICLSAISVSESNFSDDFVLLWVNIKIKDDHVTLITVSKDEQDLRLPGGVGFCPSFDLLQSRHLFGVSKSIDLWPFRNKCAKIYKLVTRPGIAFDSLQDATEAIKPILHEVKECMGPSFRIRFLTRLRFNMMFRKCRKDLSSLYQNGPRYMYESELKITFGDYQRNLASHDSTLSSLLQSLQKVVSGLARWSWYSDIFWHDYYYHGNESCGTDLAGHTFMHSCCFKADLHEARRILSFAQELACQTNFCAGDAPAHYCTFFSLDFNKKKYPQHTYQVNVRFAILRLLYSVDSRSIYVKNKDGCTAHDSVDALCKGLRSDSPCKEEAFLMRDWLHRTMIEDGWIRDTELGWLPQAYNNTETIFLGAGKVPGKAGCRFYRDYTLDEAQYTELKADLQKAQKSIALQVRSLTSLQRVLVLACQAGDLDVLRALIESHHSPALLDVLNKPIETCYQKTALICSNMKAAKYLLDFGVSTWSSSGVRGYTAYHWASHGSLGKLCVLLRKNPLGVLMKSIEGLTPREMLSVTDDQVLQKWCEDEEGLETVSIEQVAVIRCRVEELLIEYERLCLSDFFWVRILQKMVGGLKFVSFLLWKYCRNLSSSIDFGRNIDKSGIQNHRKVNAYI